MSGEPVIAILAAGASRRFGGGKLDAMAGGRRLGDFALETACRFGRPVLVVAPDTPDFALAAADAGKADLLVNPLAGHGLATSVALAAQRAQIASAGRLLLLLADMPLITAASLHELLDRVTDSAPAAVRHANGRLGIPACFPAGWFARLQALAGDRGAAELLNGSEMTRPVDVPLEELRDIDRPEDLEGLSLP